VSVGIVVGVAQAVKAIMERVISDFFIRRLFIRKPVSARAA